MLWGNTIHNKKQPEKKNCSQCPNLATKINTGKFSQIEEHFNEHKLLLQLKCTDQELGKKHLFKYTYVCLRHNSFLVPLRMLVKVEYSIVKQSLGLHRIYQHSLLLHTNILNTKTQLLLPSHVQIFKSAINLSNFHSAQSEPCNIMLSTHISYNINGNMVPGQACYRLAFSAFEHSYLNVENNRIKQLTNMAVKENNDFHCKCIYQY